MGKTVQRYLRFLGGTFSIIVTLVLTVFPAQGQEVFSWEAAAQNPGGSWSNSGWSDRSFRVLLDGDFITTSGSTVRVVLRGRTSGSYRVERVSLVRREGSTLNGDDSTYTEVTFGGSWDAGVTVSAGARAFSDPLPFDLVAGQDLFLTYWVPAGQPAVYRNGGASTSGWIITGTDRSATIDWDGLGISETRSHIYIVERLEVVSGGGETPPNITMQPADVTVTSPNAATFNVTATGSPSPTYQWRRDGVNISGATGASYTLDPTAVSDSGAQFDVVVSNSQGSVTSSTATLTVLEQAAFSWEAAAQNPGGSWSNSGWSDRSFRVLLDGDFITTSGSTVRVVLRGRTSGSYRVERVSLVRREGSTLNGDDSTYTEVTFGGSWDAGVTVSAGARAFSDPLPFDLVAGQDLFLTYWVPAGQPAVYRNGGASTSGWIITGTDQSATIDWDGLGISETRSHIYIVERLEVVSGGGETPPNITMQPADVTVTSPNAATFNVTATGSPSPTYQWRRDGVNISGATGASYTLDPTAVSDSGAQFDVVVSNSQGSVTSSTVTLTVLEQTGFSWEAAAQNPGGSWSNSGWSDRSFRVLLDGDFITTSGSTVRVVLRGRTSGSYRVERVSLVRREGNTLNGDDSTYTEVTFGGSWDAGVTVSAGARAFSDPLPFDLVAGQDLFLTYWVPAGQPAVYRNGGASTSGWIITGTDRSATIDWDGLGISETRSHIYIIEGLEVVSGGGETPPNITMQPADVTVASPNAATFNVTATGSPSPTYQWRRDGVNISGATGASYTLDPTAVSDSGAQFDVVVSNSQGSVDSNSATLTVIDAPPVAWEASAQNPGGSWSDSSWFSRSFRVLLKGDTITTTGSKIQLVLRGRTSGSYTVQRVSLVRRDGNTVNGVDSTYTEITFGGSWDAGVTVPPGATVTSDSVPFNLIEGEDLFLTYWVPSGQPAVFRNGGSTTSAWIITGTDRSATIDWGGLSISETRSHIYIAERLEVTDTRGLFLLSPKEKEIISSPIVPIPNSVDATIRASAGGFSQNWGVEFVMDGDDANAFEDYVPPHEWETSLAPGEHTVQVYMIDENGVRQTAYSDAVDFGIGDFYMAIGDSLTYGQDDTIPGDDTSNDGRNSGGGYPPILNNLLTAQKGYPHTVVNEGIRGDESTDGVANIGAFLSAHPNAQRILILFGTNDSGSSMPRSSGLGLSQGQVGYADSFKDNMNQLVTAIIDEGKTPVLAYVPIRFGDSPNSTTYGNPDTHPKNLLIQDYNMVIDELRGLHPEINVPPPDFYEYFRSTARSNGISIEFDDNLHPNGVGYQSMADLWSDVLAP